jgi:hypothetical protein
MSENLIVPTMAEMLAEGNNQKFCFGSVQEVLMIGQKNNKTFVRINRTNVSLLYLEQKKVVLEPAKELETSFVSNAK